MAGSRAPGGEGGDGASVGGDGPGEPDPGQIPGELGGADAGADVEIIDVAAGGAALLELDVNEFMPPTEAFFTFDRAGSVGQRRFALDSNSLALVSFEAEGTAASDVYVANPVAAAARGDELVVLALSDNNALFTVTYDSALLGGSDPLPLAAADTGAHAVATSADAALAVWSQGQELHGQAFDAKGTLGDEFDFGPQSCGTSSCAARVVYDGSRFKVLWSRSSASGGSLLSWGAVDEQGAVLGARNVLGFPEGLHVEEATALADERVAVLLTMGSPAEVPLLLVVDDFGALDGAVYLYRGATEGWSLTNNGDSLLIAARSGRAQGVIRQLDLTGKPISRWLVVDDSGLDTDFEPRVTLFNAGGAHAAVVRRTDGSAVTLDFDPESFP